MINKSVDRYLNKVEGLPFFYAVSDINYKAVLDELTQAGARMIRLSDFCKNEDKFPDLDELIDSFRIADVDYASNKCVLIGLGEYLALCGETEALKQIRRLKGTTLGNAHLVILLRYVTQQLKNVVAEDLKLKGQQRFLIEDDSISDTCVVNIKTQYDLGFVESNGIKNLLMQFEDGKCGRLYVKTNMDLSKSTLPIDTIDSPYSAICLIDRNFPFPESLGSNDNWSRLLSDIISYGNGLAGVFEHYALLDNLENKFVERAFGNQYDNWIYFLALKRECSNLHNPYLKYVIQHTDDFALLKKATFDSIIDIPHTDMNFDELYAARKDLLDDKNVTDSDIMSFIKDNEVDSSESIYKLTDNTLLERQAIIKWVSANYDRENSEIKKTIKKTIEKIYPALNSYMKEYTFDCGSISQDLTEYFNEYKQQKIQNRISDEFAGTVQEYAKEYTRLDTRANVLNSISDKQSSYLYWIDALGVEYLSYTQDLAKQLGLAIKIDICRADLPTITSINKQFFDDWDGNNKEKESELDDIKHKDKGGFDYSIEEAPVHLANELDVIKKAMDKASRMLTQNKCKKFIIASDHGASRLAVIMKKEEKYETDTRGEHSGRCCKSFGGCDIENHMEENGYIVLTDYGRFKGSRAANVEVHGGASLEETVIPIITLTLKNRTEDVKIKVLNSDNIKVNPKKGITLELYISYVEDERHVSVTIKGASSVPAKKQTGNQKYPAQCIIGSTHNTHYEVVFPDTKRAGTYTVDVYDGDNLIGSVNITAKGAAGYAKDDLNFN